MLNIHFSNNLGREAGDSLMYHLRIQTCNAGYFLHIMKHSEARTVNIDYHAGQPFLAELIQSRAYPIYLMLPA